MPERARAALRRFARHRAAAVGAILVLALFVFAAVGPLLSRHPFDASDFERGIGPDGLPAAPSSLFWLGADRLYRDVFTRLAVGARLSLLIAVSATALATAIGAVVGIVSGWFEGTKVDVLLMRIVDVGLAFPFLLLVMALGAALDRTTSTTIFLTLGLTGWLGTARILRAKTMQIRNLDFVVAARALGGTTPEILVRHVLPNVAGTLLVISTISVAQMILAESVLSYLGAGLAPPTPTWGYMLFEGQSYLEAAPWIALAPGIAILIAVVGFNLLGEGLRDFFDPRRD